VKCITCSYSQDSGLGHAEVILPQCNTETLTQHRAEVKGSVRTVSLDCVGKCAERGLLILFGGEEEQEDGEVDDKKEKEEEYK
jgi:hypothetical protein